MRLPMLEAIGPITTGKSCIDYIYFANRSPTNYKINYTYDWLRLDNESNHLGLYNATELID